MYIRFNLSLIVTSSRACLQKGYVDHVPGLHATAPVSVFGSEGRRFAKRGSLDGEEFGSARVGSCLSSFFEVYRGFFSCLWMLHVSVESSGLEKIDWVIVLRFVSGGCLRSKPGGCLRNRGLYQLRSLSFSKDTPTLFHLFFPSFSSDGNPKRVGSRGDGEGLMG